MNVPSTAYISQSYTQHSQSYSSQEQPNSQSTDPGRNTADSLSLSPESRRLSKEQGTTETKTAPQDPSKPKGSDQQPLDSQELQQLQQLKQRDTEVRAHEQAHLAAAGQYAAGGASFTFQNGPDGQKYAVGGEVPIDIGKEKTPEATIQKMRTVKRAALAPANPSSADRQIAAQASMHELAAVRELQASRMEAEDNTSEVTGSENTNTDSPYTSTRQTDTSSDNSQPEQKSSSDVSSYTRRRMTSAYQAMNQMG